MKKEKKRVVLDTNVFVSGLLYPQSLPNRLIVAWIKNRFSIITSDLLFSELESTLKEFDTEYQKIVDLVKKYALFVKIEYKNSIEVRDPKDEMVLLTAIEGKADYLVTGDKDLLVLKGHSKLETLKIITVREFLDYLDKQD